ncbi:S8 family serine peptidase [Aestuariibacter sp. AA17]|uniref:S8 family serine peptidase n=1 Tax=Fluctibacter corallii TaxID=2984329 RepID=A0ABT3A9X6_9ALTE|nr:S8 family serine peptidase [Aestuariibacter sp. AA17]MCV2885395.1 S8 family serine peptidase [Aestuariibacter sp. AA17]
MKFQRTLLSRLCSVAMMGSAAMFSASSAAYQVEGDINLFKEAAGNAQVASKASTYIIQMKGASAISHAAEIGELLPSNQLVAKAGNLYNASTPAMQSYQAQLKQNQEKLLKDVTGGTLIYSYVHTFNGFSAKLTAGEAEALKGHPDVLAVWKDELLQPDTANTPAFLGLSGPQGQHTIGELGEDVIIGIVDTGIAPDHPSFADDGSYSDPVEALGWKGTCDVNTDVEFTCSNKMIGARYFKESFESNYQIRYELGEFESPRDADGHGSHTAGTAAGNAGVTANLFGTDVGTLSGVAPRARIAAYKACWNSDYPEERGCFPSDTMAAIDAAVADGVDVINYSIGGSRTSLMTAAAIAKLNAHAAGVFVSVSAGNSGPDAVTVGTPAPWVMSVGNSTYTGVKASQAIEITSREPLEIVAATEGAVTKPLVEHGDVSGELVIAQPLRACKASDDAPVEPLDNATELAGKIALIERGDCAFVHKLERALASGAEAAIVYSTVGRPVTTMGGDYDVDIPGMMLSDVDGSAIYNAILEGESISVRLSAGIFTTEDVIGNQMNEGSSRGPNGNTLDIIKPDITAPGTNVLAAITPTSMFGVAGENFDYLTGTSMSAPHIAGIAALLKGQYSNWTPSRIKSAMMTTARQDITKEDGLTPADPFDFGSGHVQPVESMNPGLVYDSNYFDHLAFLCATGEQSYVDGLKESNSESLSCDELADANFAMSANQLNYPSIAIDGLGYSYTVTRTLTDVSGNGGTYTATLDAPEGMGLVLKTFDGEGNETPESTLVVEPNGKASFSLTVVKGLNAVSGQWAFGAVTFEDEAGHKVRSPIAVFPIEIDAPESAELTMKRGRGVFPVTMLYSGTTSIDYDGLVAPTYDIKSVAKDVDGAFTFNEAGLSTSFFDVPEGTSVVRFGLDQTLVVDETANLDLYVYRCTGWSCSQVGSSQLSDSNDSVTLVDPEPRSNIGSGDTYLVWVHGKSMTEASTNFMLKSWVANGAGNTRVAASTRARLNFANYINVIDTSLEPSETYIGGITFNNADGVPQATTLIEVKPQN